MRTVRIVLSGEPGSGVKVSDLESGAEIEGVRGFDIDAGPDCVVRATLWFRDDTHATVNVGSCQIGQPGSAPTNGDARVYVVTFGVQVPGMPQFLVATFEELPHPPASREEIHALSQKMAASVRMQGPNARLVGAAPQVQAFVLGWQELGK